MGGGSYDGNSRGIRSAVFQRQSASEIFSREFHKAMNPKGVTLRESRDSAEHPNSVPIILALDVTGSMGHIPEHLVKHGLPHLMSAIIEAGIADPQLMFLAIGDHITDVAPLQISQFESSDETLDMWLTRVWLEEKGGGNRGESYSLAHFFANNYVQTDAWDKRKEKGFLFTIGDERFHPVINSHALVEIMGSSELGTIDSLKEIHKAQEKWNVFHIIPGTERDGALDQWEEALGENVIFVDDHKDIPKRIAKVVTQYFVKPLNTETMKGTPATSPTPTETVPPVTPTPDASIFLK